MESFQTKNSVIPWDNGVSPYLRYRLIIQRSQRREPQQLVPQPQRQRPPQLS